MDYLNNEKFEKLKNILNQNELEIKNNFQKSLTRMVNFHTPGKDYSFRTIMEKSGLRPDIGFPVENPTYLPRICKAFQIPVTTAIELYPLAGRTLHKEYDSLYLNTLNIANPEILICTETYLDCLLKLVKGHDYATMYPNPTNSVRELTDFANTLSFMDIDDLSIDEKKQIIFDLSKIICDIGNETNWVITKIDNAFFSQKKHIRETVFEIAFACDFNIEETQRLYRSFGLFMNENTIKFDAFISFLLNLQFDDRNEYHALGQNKKMYIYKDVCSTLPYVENSNSFLRKEPDFLSLDNFLKNNEPFTFEEIREILDYS